ncbi:MAG TPA: DUF2628 domain-containing protein [Acetobacteraceae bacterium]|nr:DUF2628 domain-containing protein [Acetobacteraceae bacterium]
MRIFTAHTRPDRSAELVAEGFRWGALLFGPFWLAWHRAWIPAVLAAAALIAILALPGGAGRTMLLVAFALVLGLTGNDLRRWSLALRGYVLTDVVAARDEDAALARFLSSRPDQAAKFA